MIKVKKEFQGKNVKLKGRPKFTLGIEVDYSTAFAMNDGGLGHFLVQEKKEKKVKKETKEKKYEAVEIEKETNEDGEA